MYGIYRGSVVEIREEHTSTYSILDNDLNTVAAKEDVILIPDSEMPDEVWKLHDARSKIRQLLERIYRLETEFHKKREALREMYMDARAAEIGLVNKILRNSHIFCQKQQD